MVTRLKKCGLTANTTRIYNTKEGEPPRLLAVELGYGLVIYELYEKWSKKETYVATELEPQGQASAVKTAPEAPAILMSSQHQQGFITYTHRL